MQPIDKWLFVIPKYAINYTEHKAASSIPIQTHSNTAARSSRVVGVVLLSSFTLSESLSLANVGFDLLIFFIPRDVTNVPL